MDWPWLTWDGPGIVTQEPKGKGHNMGRVGEYEGGEGVCDEASRFDEELL